MSDSYGISSSDEEINSTEVDRSNSGSVGVPGSSLTIEESDENSDDEIVLVRKRNNTKKRAAIYSDSEEEEEVERRAFSPRTRFSITGVRPTDLTDESSEIDYDDDDDNNDDGGDGEDDEAQEDKSYIQNSATETSTTSRNDGQENTTIEESPKHNVSNKKRTNLRTRRSAYRDRTIEESPNYASDRNNTKSNASPNLETSQQSIPNSETSYRINKTTENTQNSNTSSSSSSTTTEIYESADDKPMPSNIKLKNDLYTNAVDSPDIAPRYSTQFKNNLSEQLSSTTYQTREMSSTDSDIEILSSHEPVVEIYSSDDASVTDKLSPVVENITANKDETVNWAQPKISTALSGTPNIKKQKPVNVQYVSQEFYDKEVKKLVELKTELSSAERLLEKISKSLPDGGRQLANRVERLRADVEIKSKYVSTLRIDDGTQLAQQQEQPKKEALSNNPALDWDALSNAVNQIQPTHTGKRGMATFNNQKVLTVERLKDLYGSLENRPDENVLADDPAGLKITLMDHQKHALAWLMWREKQQPRGGILADDMGLGKTLTMIALVLSAKNRAEENDAEGSESDEEQESATKGWSSKGRKDFYPGGTLVVCPASLINQWENEVQTKLSRHKLTICVHHGNNRDTKPKHLRTYDMVVTTYNIVAREQKTHGALFGMKWRRIILDEAHVIRNHKAKSSEAVCELRGKYRWALTGTPIQNKEMDVYALLKFLRCTPFDDLAHWKRWIDKSAGGQQRLNTVMKTLILRRTKAQLQEMGKLQCLPAKRTELIEVELDKDEMNVYQKIMIYSRTLFAQFLYERAERNSNVNYREDANRPTFMQSKDPNGAYYKIHEKFTKLHHNGQNVKSHEILVLLLRLRQICCHPGLIDAMLEDEDVQGSGESESDEDQAEIDLLAQLNKLAINNTSASSNVSGGSKKLQAEEEEAIARASARVLQRNNPVFDLKRPSSKMLKVLDVLKQCVVHTNDKAIVVSQWTSVLNILRTHLEGSGISTLSLNGTVLVKNRQEIISTFNSAKSKKKVLLLSLTAGGVGLNLVGANHLLLIDLHWNPQLEAQAQDRIYRVGQPKDVVIYKFMCKDTVEERIKALQDHKMEIANGVLTGAKTVEGSKLSMDDLKSLFSL